MSDTKYVVGIDLGTSNSALAYGGAGDDSGPQMMNVPQIISPGMVAGKETLASALYIPLEGELDDADVTLPWQKKGGPTQVIGAWARERGTEVSDRLVASAKSWLGNNQVDRLAPILPWSSELDADSKL